MAATNFIRGFSLRIIDYLNDMTEQGYLEEDLLENCLFVLNSQQWKKESLNTVFDLLQEGLPEELYDILTDGLIEIINKE